MMRWLIGSSVKARRAVLVAAVVVMAFGVVSCGTPRWTCSRSSHRRRSGQDRGARALGGGGRAARHDPDGAGPARGVAGRRDPVGVGARPLLHRDHLRAGNQPVPGPPGGAGAHQPGGRPPQRVAAAPDVAADVVDQPDRDGLALVEEAHADPGRRPRALDHPSAAVGGAGRLQRGGVGSAGSAAPGQVDPQTLRERKVTLQQVIRSTGSALWVSPLTFLEASSPGTGGFIDTPNQRLGIQHNLPIIDSDDLSKVVIEDESSCSPGWGTSAPWWRTAA